MPVAFAGSGMDAGNPPLGAIAALCLGRLLRLRPSLRFSALWWNPVLARNSTCRALTWPATPLLHGLRIIECSCGRLRVSWGEDDVETDTGESIREPLGGTLRMQAIKVVTAAFAILTPVADHVIRNDEDAMGHSHRRFL